MPFLGVCPFAVCGHLVMCSRKRSQTRAHCGDEETFGPTAVVRKARAVYQFITKCMCLQFATWLNAQVQLQEWDNCSYEASVIKVALNFVAGGTFS